jgi:fructosamine-3-kinase
MLDIASMPTWKAHYPRLEKFLEGYQHITKLPDNFDEKYALYKLRTLLWKTAFCHKAGILNPERLARLTDHLQTLNM